MGWLCLKKLFILKHVLSGGGWLFLKELAFLKYFFFSHGIALFERIGLLETGFVQGIEEIQNTWKQKLKLRIYP